MARSSRVVPKTKLCEGPGPPRRPRDLRPYTRLFKALGDETRLEILGLLAAAPDGPLCACDIEAHFDLSQPTISHHLKVLRDAGVVTGERRGTWVHYAIDPDTLRLLPELATLLSMGKRGTSTDP
jgi:ArsR family transcriptional regulator, arsenate/arsenite/antimonite-responsive transcriptional repressor